MERLTSPLDWRAGECACGSRAQLCVGRALQAQRTTCADRVHCGVLCTMRCVVLWFKHARLADSARCSSSLPKSLLCLQRLARHSRGEVKPAAAAASGIALVMSLLHSRLGTYSLSPPACRSLHNRRGLWPASNKLSANAAPSASSSRLAPTLPPRHRCSTLRCRLATQHPPRVSVPVRLLSRTVSVPSLALNKISY